MSRCGGFVKERSVEKKKKKKKSKSFSRALLSHTAAPSVQGYNGVGNKDSCLPDHLLTAKSQHSCEHSYGVPRDPRSHLLLSTYIMRIHRGNTRIRTRVPFRGARAPLALSPLLLPPLHIVYTSGRAPFGRARVFS